MANGQWLIAKNKMTPLVSVCVTTYNHEPYLATALDAILAQRSEFSSLRRQAKKIPGTATGTF